MVDKTKHTRCHIKYFCVGGKFTQLICRSKNIYAKNYPKLHSKLVPYSSTESRNGPYWVHYYLTLILPWFKVKNPEPH